MQLDFDARLKPAILQGKKTATIRYGWRNGKKDPRDYTKNDGSGNARFPDGSVIPLKIEYVDFVYYVWEEDHIHPEILRRENYPPNEEGFYQLLQSLKSYYPDMHVGSEVTIVYFHLRPDN